MTINKSKGKGKAKNKAPVSPATSEADAVATPEADAVATPEADAVATPEADAVATPEAVVAETSDEDVAETSDDDAEEKAAEEKAAEDKKPNRKVARVANLVNTTFHKKRDPYAEITFLPGNRVEGVKVTSWMQAQIDAGILKEVK